MHEILFRGKEKYTGEWFEGYYTLDFFERPSLDYFAIDPKEFPGEPCIREVFVDEETVGQYTGLTDGASVRIFEDDILKFPPVTFDDDSKAPAEYAVVVWGDGGWELEHTRDIGPEVLDADTANAAAIIGNIHDMEVPHEQAEGTI